jgi:hypothetical protein
VSTPRAPAHVRAGTPILSLIVIVFGLLSLVSLIGGIVAIVLNAYSETKFDFIGFRLSTGHVGVALVGIGLVTGYLTMRAVLKNLKELAALAPDDFQQSKRQR